MASDALAPLRPGLALVALSLRLAARFLPQLVALALAGALARDLLIEASVAIGFWNKLAGLIALTGVVLAQLVVTLAMFRVVRPGLPALVHASTPPAEPEAPAPQGLRGFAHGLTLTLIPFFAVYAAWGFLGDAVRDYSKRMLATAAFGQRADLLDVSGGAWLAAAVAAIWAVRRLAKALRARTGAPAFDLLVVACDAGWIFVGLYVVSGWQDEAMAFAAALPETVLKLWEGFVGAARAATPIPPPVEQTPEAPLDLARGLFFYALFPLVWLTLAAIVYGYDVHAVDEPAQRRATHALAGWRRIPAPVRDFVGHFVDGVLKRYRAVANGLRLTLGAGLALALGVVVLFRLLDWLSAWAWLGAARLIGPHDLQLWQVFASGVSLLLGAPSEPGTGVLVQPLKICLLAAALELAFASGRTFRRL